MGKLANIRDNLSPGTMLAISGVIGVLALAVAFAITRLGGNSVDDSLKGKTGLPSTPTTQQIGRDKATDEVKFDSNSQVGVIYAQAEEKKIEAAEKGKESHVSSVHLDLGEEKQVETPKPVEQPKPKGNPELESLLAKRRAQQESQVAQVATTRGANGNAPAESPWKSFLESERKFSTEYEIAATTEFDALKKAKAPASPQFFSGERKPVGSAQGSNTQGGTTGNGYQQYLPKGAAAGGSTLANNTTKADDEEWDDDSSSSTTKSSKATQGTIRNLYPSEVIAQNAISKEVEVPVIQPGRMYAAVLQIGVNTDEISPVRAVIVEKGPLEGAILTGEPVRVGEKAKIEFTTLTVGAKSFTPKAIALDTETMRSSLADDVDNHTVERYSKLFIASFVDGYASALSGTQTITSPEGSTSTTKDPLPNTGDQIKVGIGKAGEKFSPIFEREFDRPPTVTVEPNKSIFVMFTQAVDINKKD
ncbi:DotG/IcmE/VirB10 family type IV secretion system protein [Pseudomonas aeruginosa]